MRAEKTPPRRKYWPALIFLLLGTLAGAFHSRQTDQGKSDPVVGAVRGVVTPPANMLGSASRWISAQTGWILHGHAVASENAQLKARVAELEGENATLREARINYDRLRDDLPFVRGAKADLLAANVTARRPDPKFDTLIIGRGSADGVLPNSIVRTRNGLVGRVYDVTPNTAAVLMLSDQNCGVGARVQRANSRATGVCKGNYTPLLSLVYLPNNADIKAGDAIVTSGLGGVYPPGIPIGTVTEVKSDDGNVAKVARVRPYVDFDRLEEVYVQR